MIEHGGGASESVPSTFLSGFAEGRIAIGSLTGRSRRWPGAVRLSQHGRISLRQATPERQGVSPLRAAMVGTKKLPVRLDEKKNAPAAGDHLLPRLSGVERAGFLGAKSGKECVQGVICYVGKEVTPQMLLARYRSVIDEPVETERALQLLGEYCVALQAAKVGNVVSISYSGSGTPTLSVDQSKLPSEKKRSLP